jgi:heme/copper-type cytochrome/quinol oxidase subunit 3
MNKVAISIVLLSISLIFLVIYGADVLTASINSPSGLRGKGFLPFEEEIRGGVFGGGAVIMSIIGFIISRKEPSKTVSSLLFFNGGLIIIGIIITIAQANLSSENIGGMARTVSSTILLGAVLIGLGVVKTIHDKKIVSSKKETSSV